MFQTWTRVKGNVRFFTSPVLLSIFMFKTIHQVHDNCINNEVSTIGDDNPMMTKQIAQICEKFVEIFIISFWVFGFLACVLAKFEKKIIEKTASFQFETGSLVPSFQNSIENTENLWNVCLLFGCRAIDNYGIKSINVKSNTHTHTYARRQKAIRFRCRHIWFQWRFFLTFLRRLYIFSGKAHTHAYTDYCRPYNTNI